MRLALAFLLACAFARADSLSDLKARLAESGGQLQPVTATISFQSVRLGAEAPAAPEEPATIVAVDGPDGFTLRWSRELIGRPAQPEQSDEHKQRAREMIDGLKPSDAYEYLNIAGPLAEVLSRAELVEEQQDTRSGRPARRLALKLTVPLSEKDRKYIKELKAEATVWLDEDGWPLAAERRLSLKGRAMLVISFEQKETESYEFGRVGERLVVLRHEKSSQGSGGGESGGRKTVATLDVAKL